MPPSSPLLKTLSAFCVTVAVMGVAAPALSASSAGDPPGSIASLVTRVLPTIAAIKTRLLAGDAA